MEKRGQIKGTISKYWTPLISQIRVCNCPARGTMSKVTERAAMSDDDASSTVLEHLLGQANKEYG